MKFSTLTFSLGAIFWIVSSTCQPPKQDDAVADQCPDFNVAFTNAIDEQYTGFSSELDGVLEDFMQQTPKPPGCALGIVYNNEIYYLKGLGLADIASETEYTYATMQGVGSISKTLTALGIFRLADQGYLNLDDLIKPYTNDNGGLTIGQHATFREIMSHEAGIYRMPEWFSWLDTEEELEDSGLFPTLEHPAFYPRIAYNLYRLTPAFALDTGTGLYSNAGYSLLGALIDKITTSDEYEGEDRGYEQFIWHQLGLSSPYMASLCLNTYWRENDILNLATGYRFNNDGDDDDVEIPDAVEPAINPDGGPGGWRGPAGGWAMTIGDLSRLMIGINTNSKIDESQKEDMLSTMIQPLNPETMGPSTAGYRFGLGVWNMDRLSRPTFSHGGDIDGFSARFTMWPEEGFGVAIMCNCRIQSRYGALTDDIASRFFDGSIPLVLPDDFIISEADREELQALLLLDTTNDPQERFSSRWFDELAANNHDRRAAPLHNRNWLYHKQIHDALEKRRQNDFVPGKISDNLNENER